MSGLITCRLRAFSTLYRPFSVSALRLLPGDELGRGAGKGGGSGGSIREAGGAFGKIEATREEEYFRKLAAKQLKDLKEKMEDDLDHQEKEIRRLQDQIEHHKRRCKELKSNIKEVDDSTK